ncbi:MAG: hypothetical protein P8Y95_00705 [Gammaproteobacteria bacterium]
MSSLQAHWRRQIEARGATEARRHGAPCLWHPGRKGMVDLSHQGVVAFRGTDAREFLQGYLTCDMNDVASDRPVLGALCNLQGRVVTNFVAIERDGAICLRMHRSLVEPTFDAFSKYIVFSKTKMEDASDRWLRIGFPSGDLLRQAVEPMHLDESSRGDATFTLDLPDASSRKELWIDDNEEPGVIDPLLDRVPLMSPAEWDRIAIQALSPELTLITSSKYLPQMLGLDALGAVDFDKGCYLGQEIVARVQYRGEHKRELVALRADNVAEEPALGTTILAGDRAIGEVIMSAKTDRETPAELLAVLQRGIDLATHTLTLEGVPNGTLSALR